MLVGFVLEKKTQIKEFCQKMSSKRRLDEQQRLQRLDTRGNNNQDEDDYDDNTDDDDDDDNNHNAAAVAITEINYDKQHASFHLRQHIQYGKCTFPLSSIYLFILFVFTWDFLVD